MTRAEAIRKMSDDALARYLCDIVGAPVNGCGHCIASEDCRMGHNGFIDYLQEEVEEDD